MGIVVNGKLIPVEDMPSTGYNWSSWRYASDLDKEIARDTDRICWAEMTDEPYYRMRDVCRDLPTFEPTAPPHPAWWKPNQGVKPKKVKVKAKPTFKAKPKRERSVWTRTTSKIDRIAAFMAYGPPRLIKTRKPE